MRPKVTEKRLIEMIAQGQGTGIGDDYSPWLQPHKQFSSPCSNINHTQMPMSIRHGYYLSDGERDMARLLWWAGAIDVREQFPLWPWAHPSPLDEVDPVASRRWHPGMSAIADEASIRMYTYPGLAIPQILTIDLMVTFRRRGELEGRLLGISCKPRSKYVAATFGSRLRTRLELDRRYCETAAIDHHLIHPESIPAQLAKQLEWLAPLREYAAIKRFTESGAYTAFVCRLADLAFDIPVSTAIDYAGRGLDWSPEQILFAGHLAMWRLDVDVDLRQEISMASPLPRGGGRAYREAVRARLFGGEP